MTELVLGCLISLLCSALVQSCGQSALSTTPSIAASYIVGGRDANPGDFPWQVGIVENGYLICGGTYVTGNNGQVEVITAAHCVEYVLLSS
ncbi:serine protease 48-like [Ruditapes philippinarum]|uniref:serine protease 48-like n=1 Tax=Ruditapes philippinarum TaxID=129788 RepID=UPI00295ABE6E|nr:serine protease 48-like [Ruditapes philippinarum]